MNAAGRSFATLLHRCRCAAAPRLLWLAVQLLSTVVQSAATAGEPAKPQAHVCSLCWVPLFGYEGGLTGVRAHIGKALRHTDAALTHVEVLLSFQTWEGPPGRDLCLRT